MTKRCWKCKVEKDLTSFGKDKHRADGLNAGCKTCVNEQGHSYYKRNMEARRAHGRVRMKEKWNANPEKFREACRRLSKKNSWLRKLEVIEAYGSKCACCGETEPKFLTVDHKFGGGGKDPLSSTSRYTFYNRLKQLGYPKDLYQVLCFNCNYAKFKCGVCPHQKAEAA